MHVHGAGKRNGKGPSVKVKVFQFDTEKTNKSKVTNNPL